LSDGEDGNDGEDGEGETERCLSVLGLSVLSAVSVL
jgi:hypothetical protein